MFWSHFDTGQNTHTHAHTTHTDTDTDTHTQKHKHTCSPWPERLFSGPEACGCGRGQEGHLLQQSGNATSSSVTHCVGEGGEGEGGEGRGVKE